MSKLIYSPTSALIESTYEGIKTSDQQHNPVYHSIGFTGDGYIYTHGKKFRLFKVESNGVNGIVFSITNGVASLYVDGVDMGHDTVVQSVTNDGIITTSTTNGVVTVGHSEFLSAGATYGSATTVPIITVNKSGHITAISNSSTIDTSKVRADSTTATGQYYPVGVSDNTLQNPVYHSSLYFDQSGNIYTNNVYIGNAALSTLFAPFSHTSVYATDSVYGHVILSDTPSNDYDTDDHIAATPKAVMAGVSSANLYSQQLFAAQDAMVFCGTINATGVITSHNTTVIPTAVDNTTNISTLDYKVGWTFRFVTAGTFNGVEVEIGDMLIAVHAKDTNFSINDWTVIQTNISGALTASNVLTGLLYANNSRAVDAISWGTNGYILQTTGSGASFVNPNTIWRDIQVNSTSIGINTLNLIQGNAITISASNGDVTIAVNASNIIQASAALTLTQGQTIFSYKPTAAANVTIGDLLTLEKDQNDAYTLKHATGTAFTNKLGRITTDSYGHITAISDVTTLPNTYSLTIKTNSSSVLEYDGSAASVLVFKNGGDIAFTNSTDASGNKIIEAAVTHKYRGIQFYAGPSSASATALLADSSNIAFTLVAGANITLSNTDSQGNSLTAGYLRIDAEDTWRSIIANQMISGSLISASTGTSSLIFSDDFLWDDNEIGIVWTEIDDLGRVTYVK